MMGSLRIVAVALLTLLASSTAAESAHFRDGSRALAAGKYEEAIQQLEALADRGSPHPDASYNRGIAYLTRVRAGAERNGDLGRAAAAFEEAIEMRSDDDARHALELVRAEVARRRARAGKEVIVSSPSLDRVVVGFLAARSWGILAALASLLLAAGLVLRRRAEGPEQLAGSLIAPVSALVLLATVPLTLAAGHFERTTRPGVLVTREAFLTDEQGKALGGDPVTEATRLELGERRGPMIQARYGTREGWLVASTVRVLRVR